MTESATSGFASELGQARAMHRSGQLAQAQAAYSALLRRNPGNAELLGLLAVVALQQGRTMEAETLFEAALDAPADVPVTLRNLNNFLALLNAQEKLERAHTRLAVAPPAWPADKVPDDSEREMLLSLSELLALAGRADHAESVLSALLAATPHDGQALSLLGRIRLKREDAEGAAEALERAVACGSRGWLTFTALSAACTKLGRDVDARNFALQAAHALPVYVAPAAQTARTNILVLNDPPTEFERPVGSEVGLHFVKNYISQRARRHGSEYRFISLFALPGDPPPSLPAADILVNNLVGAERLNVPGRLDEAARLVDQIGVPVINHPRAVFHCTRQKNAERLTGLPGLRVPNIARYRRDSSMMDAIVADIGWRFNYPVIVRHVAADRSSNSLLSERKTALLVHDAAELREFVERQDWPEFYVVEYVNLRKSDGNFRKLRAALFPDEVLIVSGGYYCEWMVGGWRRQQPAVAFYNANPHLVAEMNRILLDPERMLGSHVLPILETIRDRMPLDYCGIDFDVDDDGSIVLFEVGATMNFLQQPGTPESQRMPPEPEERVNRAFDRLVASKIAGADPQACQLPACQTPTP